MLSLDIPGDVISSGSSSGVSNSEIGRIPAFVSTKSNFHTSHSAIDLPRIQQSLRSEVPRNSSPVVPPNLHNNGNKALVPSFADTTGTNNLIDLGPQNVDWNQAIEDVIFDPLLVNRQDVSRPKFPSTRGPGLPLGLPSEPLERKETVNSTTMELLEELFMPQSSAPRETEKDNRAQPQSRPTWEHFE